MTHSQNNSNKSNCVKSSKFDFFSFLMISLFDFWLFLRNIEISRGISLNKLYHKFQIKFTVLLFLFQAKIKIEMPCFTDLASVLRRRRRSRALWSWRLSRVEFAGRRLFLLETNIIFWNRRIFEKVFDQNLNIFDLQKIRCVATFLRKVTTWECIRPLKSVQISQDSRSLIWSSYTRCANW